MSQFNVRFAALLVLPLLLLCVCLVRLRGAALVLFASGFAGTALEIVLLLAFQVLCGSVYHQVGIIVTVFMAGLAVGALMTNRLTKPGRGALPRALADAQVGPTLSTRGCAKNLALLALSIAGYAAVLPFLLPLLYRLGGPAAGLLMLKTAVALLTLIPAVLVGMQFPLANHLEFGGTTAAASRLYTADFVGAFLGALLAGALLIPLIGVAGVCALIAGLNLFAAAMMQLRKAVT